mgnify:CR=1 FL=1
MIALALSAVVLAQADTVLILRSSDEAWRPFEARLAAELVASGLKVRAVDAEVDPQGDIPSQLWVQCRDEDAVAALWFQPRADGRVDAWVADKVTAKAVLRTYEQPQSGAERARLALRAVELLHASLLEVRLMAPSVSGEHPELRRFAAQRRVARPHWVFGTGVGMVVTPGLRPQPLLELQLGYELAPAWLVELQVLSSVFPARVDAGPTLGADVGVAMVRALAQWSPLRGETLSAGLIAGTGAALTWATGATDKLAVEAATEAQAAWLLTGGIAVSSRVSEGIRLQLLSCIGFTVPEVGVRLAGVAYAHIGRPIIDVLLRLEFE